MYGKQVTLLPFGIKPVNLSGKYNNYLVFFNGVFIKIEKIRVITLYFGKPQNLEKVVPLVITKYGILNVFEPEYFYKLAIFQFYNRIIPNRRIFHEKRLLAFIVIVKRNL